MSVDRKLRPRLLRIRRWALLHDPAHINSRTATAATTFLAVSLGLCYSYAKLVGTDATLAVMCFGGVPAMQVSLSLINRPVRDRLRLSVMLLVFAAAGASLCAVLFNVAGLGVTLAALVPMTYATIAIRRFGADYATLGLICWVAYYLWLFFGMPTSTLPIILGAQTISALTAFALSTVFVVRRPSGIVDRCFRSWEINISLLQADCLLLHTRHVSGWTRRRLLSRVRTTAHELSTLSLMIEGWLAQVPTAATTSIDPGELRQVLLSALAATDTLVEHVADDEHGSDPSLQCRGAEGFDAARARLAAIEERRKHLTRAGVTARYASVTPAAMIGPYGILAGHAGPAATVAPQRWPWKSSLPTRQALQATIAIACALPLAYLISTEHYSWAVLAIFIICLGTTTSDDVVSKSAHRVVGTAVGLGIGQVVSFAVNGNPIGTLITVIVVCFIGHYLMFRSYGYMMACITVAITQLYALMGKFDADLIELRLGETALGAAIAVLVVMTVATVRARDVISAIQEVAEKKSRELSTHLDSREFTEESHLLGRQLEHHAYQLRAAAMPLHAASRRRVRQLNREIMDSARELGARLHMGS